MSFAGPRFSFQGALADGAAVDLIAICRGTK
ncbi:hypothetical protein X747_26895 [Mesorhizobium sp. LNJC384A00]|nr:hypothetical protein X747_26895 [Mesorhizobium sp. LNJC384A00]